MSTQTIFGSLANYTKGSIEITGRETTSRYLFSNVFEVAANAAPWERIVVAKNLEFTIEVSRSEQTSPWYICAHDETILVLEGKVEIRFIKPERSDLDRDKEGAVRLDAPPQGSNMGRIVASLGHLSLLPGEAAYQIHAQQPGVCLIQSVFGEESIEKWSQICLQ